MTGDGIIPPCPSGALPLSEGESFICHPQLHFPSPTLRHYKTIAPRYKKSGSQMASAYREIKTVRFMRPGSAGGGSRIRTGDILLAKQTLYQLSYAPLSNEQVIVNSE